MQTLPCLSNANGANWGGCSYRDRGRPHLHYEHSRHCKRWCLPPAQQSRSWRPAVCCLVTSALTLICNWNPAPVSRLSKVPKLRHRSARRACENVAEAGVALVTGAGRGIGAAIARVLGQEGYTVAVNFRASEAAAASVAEEICKNGGRAMTFKADVAHQAEVVKLYDEVAAAWPDIPLMALVNNAGVIGSRKGVLECADEANMQAVFAPNVLGPLVCCREFMKRASKGASIVNIGSGAATKGSPGLYAMSKAALHAMQLWMVPQLSKLDMRMNTVVPGRTKTDMTASSKFDPANIPMGRFGEPEEVANAVAFLLSSKASYISGSYLRVAGGRA